MKQKLPLICFILFISLVILLISFNLYKLSENNKIEIKKLIEVCEDLENLSKLPRYKLDYEQKHHFF